MNNTQLKVKQQVIDYLNNYEITGDSELDKLFNKPKHEVYKYALELNRSKAHAYTKSEYMEFIESLGELLNISDEAKEGQAILLKRFEAMDFDAMFITANNKIFHFKNGYFEKQYIDNLIAGALSEYKKEVIEITLLDTLWVTTEDHSYRVKCESKLYDLAERVAYDIDMAVHVDQVEYIVGDIIMENTANINRKYIDIEF